MPYSVQSRPESSDRNKRLSQRVFSFRSSDDAESSVSSKTVSSKNAMARRAVAAERIAGVTPTPRDVVSAPHDATRDASVLNVLVYRRSFSSFVARVSTATSIAASAAAPGVSPKSASSESDSHRFACGPRMAPCASARRRDVSSRSSVRKV